LCPAQFIRAEREREREREREKKNSSANEDVRCINDVLGRDNFAGGGGGSITVESTAS